MAPVPSIPKSSVSFQARVDGATMATLPFAFGKRPAKRMSVSEESISGADISMNKQALEALPGNSGSSEQTSLQKDCGAAAARGRLGPLGVPGGRSRSRRRALDENLEVISFFITVRQC